MRNILIASGNKNKIREIKDKFKNTDINFIELIEEFDPEETGETLQENARIKAVALKDVLNKDIIERFNITGIISDDSGLFIEGLNGRPGVRSARYAGENKDFNANIEKVLKETQNIFNRSAYMETVICYIDLVTNKISFFIGKAYGGITFKPIGNNGFAYDSIFFSDELNKTFGEATIEEKQEVSSRAKALESFKEYIEKKN